MQESDAPTGPAQPPRVVLSPLDGRYVMRFPRGQIDGLAIREMYELTVQLPEHPPPVLIIDLDGLGYMSSGALGMLVNMHRKCRGHGGRMHIVAPSEHLREPFTVTRLDKVLTLHDTMPGPDAPGRNP